MIRIQRPRGVPAILKTKGAAARKALCKRFATGQTTFTFDPAIYGHATVKRALIKAQHEKCCFCESKVTHVSSGHIEHFRPKGGIRLRAGEALTKPGYFWLAYEWTNLLFCCEICNSRFKKNFFPLVKPNARARQPADDIKREQPIFIDPAAEDPAAQIGFREEYPFAIKGNRRGEATWKALGLDREELAEMRRDHLALVKTLKKVRDGTGPKGERTEAGQLLGRMASKKGQWSAMVRAALAP